MREEIEVSPYNNMLGYRKGYTASFVKDTIDKRKLAGLMIFDHLDRLDSLSFLKDYGFLKKLNIDSINDQDFGFLKYLTDLDHLRIGLSVKESNVIDLSNQQNLESLDIKWRKGKIIGLEKCQNLTSLCLVDFKEVDFSAVTQLIKLKELIVKTSAIRTVNGLSSFPLLENLVLGNCRSLKSIEDIAGLKNLISLEIDLCSKIEDYSSIGSLTKLKNLGLLDCKGVNSIKFVEGLKYLQKLSLLGTTDVLDGDMKPAKNVKNVFYYHRKHYNLKIENKEHDQLIKSNLEKIIKGLFNSKA